ncbi:MAG: electron transfer flavoprotein subunit alpha/FixB family protein [candidate division Zixibacteria bacterium]|nr:electron transfer flavoprotein subunit alpha/FixB family protein [candidate division Zixibacteria bacterium]
MSDLKVLVFAQKKGDKLSGATFELLNIGRQLADKLSGGFGAIILGSNTESPGKTAIGAGADVCYTVENAELDQFHDDSYAQILAELIKEKAPQVILGAANSYGKALFGRLAALLGASLAADCIGLDISADGKLTATRPAFGGKAHLTVEFKSTPQIATVRPKIFPEATIDEGRSGTIEAFSPSPEALKSSLQIEVAETAAGGELSLTEADIIVSGGRGLKETDNIKYVRELADAVGGAVGASRAIVDAGWIPYKYQVGQTGKTVNPKLYFALGISGAIQHLVGMQTSGTIVAVNRDPDAPIFNVATYGIVGDLFEIVPALAKKFKEELGG